jgi:nitroreductase
MPTRAVKPLTQAISERRATPSFDSAPIAAGDLRKILEAGLNAPSGYNLQPWRFVVVQTAKQKKLLREASFNQAKVEEASAVIVACGDAEGWSTGDLEEMIRLGVAGGMPEHYAESARKSVPQYLSTHPNIQLWVTKQVMIAFTSMMLMAEVMGYDTAPMEGFEPGKVREVLHLPASYTVVALLAIGHLKGSDKHFGGRFDINHTVFSEEHGRSLSRKP